MEPIDIAKTIDQFTGAINVKTIPATKFDGEKSSKNATYVDAVARTNVVLGLDNIRRRSPILADLEKKGSVQIAGAMYDITTGMVEFLS